jgi:hypothetical protein
MIPQLSSQTISVTGSSTTTLLKSLRRLPAFDPLPDPAIVLFNLADRKVFPMIKIYAFLRKKYAKNGAIYETAIRHDALFRRLIN